MSATKKSEELLRAIETLSGMERPLRETTRTSAPGGQAYDQAPSPPPPRPRSRRPLYLLGAALTAALLLIPRSALAPEKP